MARVLIACEYSGIIRDAFIATGHDAHSCDLLPTERPNWTHQEPFTSRTHHPDRGYHWQCDVMTIIGEGWDLMIAHPPCTHLAVSGARWFKDKRAEQEKALEFVYNLMCAPINRICIENPISIISSRIRKPDQIIQPWMFGHGETKATCLWLKNLPTLAPTNIVEGREARIHRMPPSPDRWKERSRTLPGIADAMADQWGKLL